MIQSRISVYASERLDRAIEGWYDYTGRTREEISEKINRRLLRQLALYQACEKEDSRK